MTLERKTLPDDAELRWTYNQPPRGRVIDREPTVLEALKYARNKQRAELMQEQDHTIKQHRWVGPIYAWATGRTIQFRSLNATLTRVISDWTTWEDDDFTTTPNFDNPCREWRVAPKE